MIKKFTRIKAPHWYKTFIEECPVCGRGSSHKERVYGKKPKDPNKLYDYTPRYDWCEG